LSLAKSLASDDRQDEAVQLLRREQRRHPAATQISGLLAELYLRQYDLAAAAEVLEASPVDDKADMLLWRSHGLYADATQDWEQAQHCLARAAHDNPDDLASAYKLGLALEALGRHADAERQLAQAARLERFQTALVRFGREREGPAAALAPQAVEIASLLVELGRPSEALPWLDQVLKWIPRDTDARALRAQAAAAHAGVAGPAGTPADAHPVSTNAAARRPATRPAERPRLASPESPIVLRDCHQEAGLVFNYFNGAKGSKYLLETLGGGVAVLDYDGDGWPDLYFAQGAAIPPLADDSVH
jgi:tetratricopeptide (TPR) repeat protein